MAVTTLTEKELFDPDFLTAVSRLKILARRVARGGVHAEQRSRHLGAGMEFRDYRAYAPGDDLRAIDWNIYRRHGRLFLRLFEEFEDLPVYVAPDVSTSMFQTGRPRARAALRTAFALAAIALSHRDSVGLYPFSDRLEIAMPPRTGMARLTSIAHALARQQPGGRTDFVASLGRLAHMNLRPGLLVVISDFFDPDGIDAVVAALKAQRHRLLLVQLYRPTDADPDLAGDLLLQDCETGVEHDVSVTAEVRAAYRRIYAAFAQGLATFAASRQAGLARIDVDRPVVPQLAELFETGTYVV